MTEFQEYPKALYAAADASGYAVAANPSDEEALRAQGLRMLPEWYALSDEDAARAAAEREAAAQAEAEQRAAAEAQARADAAELAQLRTEKAEREAAAAKPGKK